MITASLVQTILRKRRREIHKGDCGRILIAAGTEGMMGAAVLSCRAALQSGAGLVQLAVPKELFPVAQVAVPEATCRTRSFLPADLARYDAVAIGPGLGTEEKSVEAVRNILEYYEGNLVLDADALNIVAEPSNGCLRLLQSRKGETVITPHIGEAKRLLRITGSEWQTPAGCEERQAMAEALTELTGAVTVLKGAGTVVATKDFGSYTNTTGNPGMATGGSGDVLTGIIAGLWGQIQPDSNGEAGRRIRAHEAAFCGVFIHGLAGDLAAETYGEYGLTAGDIAANTPFAIKDILER